jgi:hypothetical protein
LQNSFGRKDAALLAAQPNFRWCSIQNSITSATDGVHFEGVPFGLPMDRLGLFRREPLTAQNSARSNAARTALENQSLLLRNLLFGAGRNYLLHPNDHHRPQLASKTMHGGPAVFGTVEG